MPQISLHCKSMQLVQCLFLFVWDFCEPYDLHRKGIDGSCYTEQAHRLIYMFTGGSILKNDFQMRTSTSIFRSELGYLKGSEPSVIPVNLFWILRLK